MKSRRLLLVVLLLALCIAPLTTARVRAADTVELTLGSWRTDDAEAWKGILDAFHTKYPNITVKFDPTNPPDYNATLRTQLEAGTGPDLFYLRSFTTSQQLFKEGFIAPLKDLEGLTKSFSKASTDPWTSLDGVPYGVPLAAVSHGIYYNKDIFKKLNLEIPKTWKELLDDAKKIKDSGTDVFANGSGDAWTIAEIVFMNLAPTFIGGYEGREAYLKGDRCFNDENSVSAFQAIADIAPYLPKGQEALKDNDTQQIFLQGQAAMRFGGSWDMAAFEKDKPDFEWGVFAIPAPEGKKSVVTFHFDAAIGMNAKSTHAAEAKQFLEWLETPEFANLYVNALSGFYPLLKDAKLDVKDPHADEFFKLNEGRTTDIRWAWEGLLDGQPDGYSLMQDNAIAIIGGKETPKQAADALQDGLAKWFKPAQTCKKSS